MQYNLTRKNLEIAYIALEYAVADAVDGLVNNVAPLNAQGRAILSSIEIAKTILNVSRDALYDLEVDTESRTSH